MRPSAERVWSVFLAFVMITFSEPPILLSSRSSNSASLANENRRFGRLFSSPVFAQANADFLNLADVQCGAQVFLTARKKRSTSPWSSPPSQNAYQENHSRMSQKQHRSLAGFLTSNNGEQPSSIVYHVISPPDATPAPAPVEATPGGGRRRRWVSRVFDGVAGFFTRLFGFSHRIDDITSSTSTSAAALHHNSINDKVLQAVSHLQGTRDPEIISIGVDANDDNAGHSNDVASSNNNNGIMSFFTSTNKHRRPLQAQRISVFGHRRNSTAYVIDTVQSASLPASAASTLFAPPGTVGLDRQNVTRLATIIREVLNARRPPQQFDSSDAVKIVGGQTSVKGEFPFIVSLKRGRQNFCGGSILNRRYVLTAAHCVQPRSPDDILVVAGEYDITKDDQELVYPVENIIVHPGYADIPGLSNPNDVALLRLGRDLEWSPFVQPICLPNDPNNMQLMRRDATVLGWGRITEGGPQSSILRQVTLPILPRFLCYLLYYRLGFSSNHLCAGGRLRGGRDACHGDSGGPLVVREEGRFVLAGIVSGGKGCGRPLTSGIYMNAARYVKWITTEMYNDHVVHNYLK